MSRPIRAEVVDLLADHHPERSDFTCQPWRLVHEDGRPFTAAESALANSATIEETLAAQRLAAGAADMYRRKRDDLARVQELLTPYVDADPDRDIIEIVADMPEPARSEAISILSRYSPEDLQS